MPVMFYLFIQLDTAMLKLKCIWGIGYMVICILFILFEMYYNFFLKGSKKGRPVRKNYNETDFLRQMKEAL